MVGTTLRKPSETKRLSVIGPGKDSEGAFTHDPLGLTQTLLHVAC